jgi:GNAT superfamily N-acetyltransferase
MAEEYKIVHIEKIEDDMWGVIGGGIQNYNNQKAGDDHGKRLCFVVYGPEKEIAGGVIAVTYWDWLYIDLMWMKEELRGHGYGSQLLGLAEEEARKRGAKHVYLDTFSFQAPEFYKRHGYQVFGELKDFPHGHQRYFLTKDL